MEIRRRQTSARSASESAALGKAGHGSAETGRAVPSVQSKKEPLAALFLCAAARRIRGGTPHPPRQARHLPPLGKAKDYFCFHAVCKVSAVSVALKELYSRNLTKPSPVGEGGPLAVDEVSRTKAKRAIRESPLRDSGNPLHIVGRRLSPAAPCAIKSSLPQRGKGDRLRWMRCSRAKAKRAIRESPLRDSGNPMHIAGRRLSPAAFPSALSFLQYLVKLSYFASVS